MCFHGLFLVVGIYAQKYRLIVNNQRSIAYSTAMETKAKAFSGMKTRVSRVTFGVFETARMVENPDRLARSTAGW